MYSTCLFCHASLGANEAVERFPVGRRRRNALLAAGAGAAATAAVGIGGVVAGVVTAATAAALLNVGHTARADIASALLRS